jgi:hypothetical protein
MDVEPLKPVISKLLEKGFSNEPPHGSLHLWPTIEEAKKRLQD